MVWLTSRKPPNTTKLSGAQLGQRITESTVHLSCLMTMAQIEQVREPEGSVYRV